jgi:hypothetical protein
MSADPEDGPRPMGLQPRTLAAWGEDGSRPHAVVFKIGKAVRDRDGDVIAFLNARRAMSTPAAQQLKGAQIPAKADDDGSRGDAHFVVSSMPFSCAVARQSPR